MTRKSFVVILGISVITTYIASFIEILLSGNVVAGTSGFPFKFGSSSLFGGSSTNYPTLILDIVFWFLVIWGIRKLILKLRKK